MKKKRDWPKINRETEMCLVAKYICGFEARYIQGGPKAKPYHERRVGKDPTKRNPGHFGYGTWMPWKPDKIFAHMGAVLEGLLHFGTIEISNDSVTFKPKPEFNFLPCNSHEGDELIKNILLLAIEVAKTLKEQKLRPNPMAIKKIA